MTPRSALLFAIGAAATFALFAPLGKWLVGAIPALQASALAYILSGLALAALGGLAGSASRGGALCREDLPRLAGSIFFGGLAGPGLLLLGLERVPAYQGSLLLNFEAVFTVAAGIIIGRERPGWRSLAGALGVGLAGVGVSLRTAHGPGGFSTSIVGATCVIGACLSWALDNTISRGLAKRDPRQVAMIKGLAGGGIGLAIAAPRGLVWPSPLHWLVLGVAGSVCLGASLVLYLLSLRKLGIAVTGAVFALSTPMSFALSVLLLGEKPGILGAASLVLAAGATALLASEPHGALEGQPRTPRRP